MTKRIFLFDTWLSLISGGLGLLWPSLILSMFSSGRQPPVAVEMTRWFCMFLFSFGLLQWRAPRYGVEAIRFFHRTAFIADVIYPFVFFSLMRNGGSFTFMAFATILYHFFVMWRRREVLQSPSILL